MLLHLYEFDVRGDSYNSKESLTLEIDYSSNDIGDMERIEFLKKHITLPIWFEGQQEANPSIKTIVYWQGE
jgi:hypothetical protein